jgi:hypothetical protein
MSMVTRCIRPRSVLADARFGDSSLAWTKKFTLFKGGELSEPMEGGGSAVMRGKVEGEWNVAMRRGEARRSRERECGCSVDVVMRVSVRVECRLKEKNLEAVRVAPLNEYDEYLRGSL